MGLKTTKSFS